MDKTLALILIMIIFGACAYGLYYIMRMIMEVMSAPVVNYGG